MSVSVNDKISLQDTGRKN